MELSGDMRFGSTAGVDYLYSNTAAYEFYPGAYHKDREREFYGLFVDRYPERVIYQVGEKEKTVLSYHPEVVNT